MNKLLPIILILILCGVGFIYITKSASQNNVGNEAATLPASPSAGEPPASAVGPEPTPAPAPVAEPKVDVTAKAKIETPVKVASVPEKKLMENKTTHISAAGYAFSPASIKVHVSDVVIWSNTDSASHTVTSDTGSELASDYFKKGESFTHTFKSKGTFTYHCEPHPWMKGTIIVE